MNWDHAIAATPWPTRIFLNYDTVDTTKDNGCLRIIPGAQLGRGGRPAPPHLPPAAPSTNRRLRLPPTFVRDREPPPTPPPP